MALIELKNIVKNYNDEGEEPTIALDGVSLNIEKGEFVAIMGPSGSGKSTLLHVLGFLDPPTSGEYRFDGKFFSEYSKEEVAHVRNKKMGFIFQAFNLLPRTSVFENVKLPLLYSDVDESKWDKLAADAINAVGLSHRMNHDSSQLSGGEKQRVAIARAMINHPDVIIADEPTGNLDPINTWEIIKLLTKINELGTTVLLATHNKDIVNQLDQRVISLEGGKIIRDEQKGKYILV